MVPTEDKVAALVGMCRGDNEPFPPMSPRRVVPTLQSIAANAAMAGCRTAYFPVVVAAVRGVLETAYNLHGTLATTHPCGPGIIVCGPIRHEIGLNCGSNCFGQGNRANAATAGRRSRHYNVGGAKPGRWTAQRKARPRSSVSASARTRKRSWAPHHVRRGFAADESVITVSSSELPTISTTMRAPLAKVFSGRLPGRSLSRHQQYLRQGPIRCAWPRTRRDHSPRRLDH